MLTKYFWVKLLLFVWSIISNASSVIMFTSSLLLIPKQFILFTKLFLVRAFVASESVLIEIQ